jgi:site-specific DNA recombinase
MNTIPGHVAIYCRISHDPLRQEVGVDRQRSDCIALSEATWPGLPSVLYTDNDLTAANEAVLRPAWQRMLNDIRSGEAVQLVAYEQSRLTRQPIEWEQLLIAPGRRGITSIHTVREGEKLIAEGPGRMVSRIMAAVDAEFAETTKLRVRRAMRQLAVEGRPNGGRPFGYRSGLTEDGRKTRLIVPEEAALIRWACSRILSGDTLASIARSFDKRGVTHVKKGRTWSGPWSPIRRSLACAQTPTEHCFGPSGSRSFLAGVGSASELA